MAPIMLKPEGLALAIVVMSILLMSVSTIVLALRIYVRMELKAVGMDDYLMIVGWVRAWKLLGYGVGLVHLL
jgi:hypothetical protein